MTSDRRARLIAELSPGAGTARALPDTDRRVAAEAVAGLRSGSLAALRADGPVHLTVSCLPVCCGPDRWSVALGLHERSGQWRQPGGHLEATDADLRSAALRELSEETALGTADDPGGLRLLTQPIAVRTFTVGTRDCAAHVDVLFAALADEAAPLASQDAGLTAPAWWPDTALPEAVAPDLREQLPVLLDRIARWVS